MYATDAIGISIDVSSAITNGLIVFCAGMAAIYILGKINKARDQVLRTIFEMRFEDLTQEEKDKLWPEFNKKAIKTYPS